jgi:hypothetical protein
MMEEHKTEPTKEEGKGQLQQWVKKKKKKKKPKSPEKL